MRAERDLRPARVVALLAALLTACASDAPASLPKEVEAVRKHLLERDYPELFGDDAYRTRIENLLVTDLDGDGSREAVALFLPHYRQSPTIVIYRLTQDLEVTRVMEGLAPGPLRPLSGDYLDSHALGEAIDFRVDMKPEDHDKVLRAALSSGFGGMVEYATFSHADNRKGDLSFVDMTSVEVPDGRDTCAEFEFSRVDAITAGAIEGETGGTWLAARVGSQLWLYRIVKFLPNGLLEKEVRVLPLPDDFRCFEPGRGSIRYRTSGGEVRPLRPAP